MGNTPGKAGTGKFCGFLGLADERKKRWRILGPRVVIETKKAFKAGRERLVPFAVIGLWEE